MAAGELPDEERTITMIESLEVGTLHSLADLQQLIPRVMLRLKYCNWAKMAGGLASAVTGVVAAGLAYSGAPTTETALSTAAFASAGGIATLMAGQFERSPSGARVSLAGDVDKIISLRAEVERMRRRLARRQAMPIGADEAKRMIDQLDVVAENLVKLSYA